MTAFALSEKSCRDWSPGSYFWFGRLPGDYPLRLTGWTWFAIGLVSGFWGCHFTHDRTHQKPEIRLIIHGKPDRQIDSRENFTVLLFIWKHWSYTVAFVCKHWSYTTVCRNLFATMLRMQMMKSTHASTEIEIQESEWEAFGSCYHREMTRNRRLQSKKPRWNDKKYENRGE